MKVCVAAPIATQDVAPFLDGPINEMPAGYPAAPLTAVLIGELLNLGCRVVGITVDYRMGVSAPSAVARGPGFEFHVLPGRARAWRPNGRYLGRALDLFRLERRRVAEAILKVAPDVVHAHWTYEFALGALDTAVPHVITVHDAPGKVLRYTRSPYRALRYLMAMEALRKARHVTAVSDYMARETERLALAPIQVVPNPLAPYALSLGRIRSKPSGHRIGMVCNGWSRLKNPEPALRAFHRFRAGHADAELHLFGVHFGPGEIAEQWTARNGIGEGMVFHGSVPHRELIGQLEALDALLHPSLEESFGVVVAEAMALGLPVVAGRMSGAVPWVVGATSSGQSRCAVLADVSDESSISAALEQVFDSAYMDRSREGLTRARATFDPAVVASGYLREYELAWARQHGVPNVTPGPEVTA